MSLTSSTESRATAPAAVGATTGNGPRALLLGMVYTDESCTSPKVGQEFRDRQRCEALSAEGYQVFTLDDKHSSNEAVKTRHCKSNFCDERRMSKWFKTVWEGKGQESCAWYGDYAVDKNTWNGRAEFNLIILDYFFSPNSWTKVRWAETLFTRVLPAWATNNMLLPTITATTTGANNNISNSSNSSNSSRDRSSEIWMPHVAHVNDMLSLHGDILRRWYDIEFVTDPMENPLYRASARPECEAQLLRCQEKLNNANQLTYLLQYSNTPFVRFTLRPVAEHLTLTQLQGKENQVKSKKRKVAPTTTTAASAAVANSVDGRKQKR